MAKTESDEEFQIKKTKGGGPEPLIIWEKISKHLPFLPLSI